LISIKGIYKILKYKGSARAFFYKGVFRMFEVNKTYKANLQDSCISDN